MDIRRRIGLTVKELRGKKGWSQEELGFETELHRTYISGIERGVRNPTVTVLARLADALGVTPGRLLEKNAKQGKRRS
jgi:transcriptional regulator with XRE-family HTH domain